MPCSAYPKPDGRRLKNSLRPSGFGMIKERKQAVSGKPLQGKKQHGKSISLFLSLGAFAFLFERFSLVSEEEGGDCSRSAMRGNDRADIEHFYLAFEFGELFFERLLRFFGKFGTI